MNDQALSETALQAALRGIRLPAEAAGGVWAELAAAIALAAALALVVALLLRPFLTRPAPKPDLSQQIDALAPLPEAEQRIGFLTLLKRHDPDYLASIREALYRPDTAPDTATLRAALERHV
ncbi:hypothetical protein [Antarctobacter sp.]|uniref:hypothetical protein n=1 Tax=Antarctobacter sp. TaxID=1872577 RepID=UPI003A9494F1